MVADNALAVFSAPFSINNELYVVSFVINNYTNSVQSIDVLYSLNAKKRNRLGAYPRKFLHFLPIPKLVYPICLIMSTNISLIFYLKKC